MASNEDIALDSLTEVAPDILRIKIPLPFPPGEVNAWLLDDQDGWTLIDCGVDEPSTRTLYARILSHPQLRGRPLARLLVTHFHPDHVGLAGWLHASTGVDIHMSRTEWMQARLLLREQPDELIQQFVAHNRLCGAPKSFLAHLQQRGVLYPKWVGDLPRRYTRIAEGDELILAGSKWRVLIGEGHAPEMICLYSADRQILIAADQILPRISPHVGAQPSDPRTDNLGLFLRSLRAFEALPDGTYVLPSHGEPFHGLHARTGQLRVHHADRLDRLVHFCSTPRTAMDTLEVLFRPLQLEQIGFGLSEALAHLNHLVCIGGLEQAQEEGSWRFARR